MAGALYDSISTGYATARREDPRVAAAIHGVLGDAHRVVNVGAGTGNYEPRHLDVVAVDPSGAMLAQRPAGSPPALLGRAEHLPLAGASCDVALAVLTLHHWTDLDAGLREMQRVAARQVVFLFDPSMTGEFWALEYFREAATVPSERGAPDAARIARVLDVREVRPVAIPWDCTDGFGAAYWGRPEAYLDPGVQAAMSWLAQLPPATVARGTARLADDLATGRWDERYGHLRSESERDVGYRLVVAGSGKGC